jgi:transcription elongation GreA/GreB family factor
MNPLKLAILNHIHQTLDQQTESLQSAITAAKESRDNETKSSVGDKYETGRAMVQMELEKNRVQLNKTLQLKNHISQINPQKQNNTVEFGSLVFTSAGNYFISIGMGKIEVKNESFFCISLASPMGKMLHQKKSGDKIIFQGKEIFISGIL